MGKSSEHRKSDHFSTVDFLRRALIALFKKIKYCTGRIFIDILMRNVVAWYDRRHSIPSPNRKQHESQEKESLLLIIEKQKNVCNELKAKNNRVEEEKKRLMQQVSQLSALLSETKTECSSYQDKMSELNAAVLDRETELEAVKKRCLPEKEVPSMLYYAQGDTSGMLLRKVSPLQTIGQTYQMVTKQGDTSVCRFWPLVQSDMQEIIDNRNVTLLACEIVGISSNPSAIKVVEDGQAVLNANKWKVTKKAKIILE